MKHHFISSVSILFTGSNNVLGKWPVVLLLLFFTNSTQAQTLQPGETNPFNPSIFIKENYESISIDEKENAPEFNSDNGGSYLLFIANDAGLSGHILYQIGESGKIVYLAVSDNLKSRLNCKFFLKMQFDNCIRRLRKEPFLEDYNASCLECLMNRLNACL